MSKRKPIDKRQARERRDRLLESAAAAELSLTEGVREMRAISGMTQDEFARHRGVSARVIKAIELDQGNPTVATLNRIGEFFGLEVAFVPIRRAGAPAQGAPLAPIPLSPRDEARWREQERLWNDMQGMFARLSQDIGVLKQRLEHVDDIVVKQADGSVNIMQAKSYASSPSAPAAQDATAKSGPARRRRRKP